MYTRLTKTIMSEGRECIACIHHGTDKCRIHTGRVADCAHCEMFGAILNQLHAFEEAVGECLDKEKNE